MIEFSIENIHIDPEGTKIKEEHQALLNIGATLKIFIDGHKYFEEPYVTIVELAKQLSNWLKNKNGGFVFESMDDEEQEILIFRKTDSGWFLHSAWQEFEMQKATNHSQLCAVASKFISIVKSRVANELGVNLETIAGL